MLPDIAARDINLSGRGDTGRAMARRNACCVVHVGAFMADVTDLGPSCRHFNGRFTIMQRDGAGACAIGHPIVKIVRAATGGDFRLAYKLPCKPGPERAAECPNYDPRTPEEIEAKRQADRAAMQRLMDALPGLMAIKASMIEAKQSHGVFDCPGCGGKEVLNVAVALGYNDHMRCGCSACSFGFIE